MSFSLSPRSALVLIAALFIVPLVSAWLMYTGVIDFKPVRTKNLGQLVEPPVPLEWTDASFLGSAKDEPATRFNEHWVVVHPVNLPCRGPCISDLEALRQVHKASGRHQDRIRLAVLLPAGASQAQQDDISAIYPTFTLLTEVQSGISNALRKAGAGGSNYLVDPLGNIMMRYEAGADPNDLKQDLKRLLTWSKLDEQ